ncbi:MAG: anhydro-N-acetylmuramic acid kinase [Rhodospirillales bacterium]
MTQRSMRRAIGLMSGTSMDGIDAALIETNGELIRLYGPSLTVPYRDEMKKRIRSVLGGKGDVAAVERDLTLAHAEAVALLVAQTGPVDVIGFHGQTILHDPDNARTWQIGDGDLLARETGIDVVFDFRSADVAAGGQGAPLAPVLHRALARNVEARPLAVLNLGGVGNVTWIGGGDGLLAFDTGPANALVDDWVEKMTGAGFDKDGALARSGSVDEKRIERALDNPWFDRMPPKSLDRYDFNGDFVEGLSAADGAATLTAFSAACVARALEHLPEPPELWLVCGGGRHNRFLMAELRRRLDADVRACESVRWQGDALEAQAFAFMAVRSLEGLPISFPGTTGIAEPLAGGRLALAPKPEA